MSQPTTTEPSIAQQLLRTMGREMYEAGRPIADCLTRDERIGYLQAQAASQTLEPAGGLQEGMADE